MSDVRGLGSTGQAVFQNAEKLKKAGVIDDAQFSELTNDKVGPQDIAIGRAALDKINMPANATAAQADEAMGLLRSAGAVNKDILSLQKEQTSKSGGGLLDAIGSKVGGFFNFLMGGGLHTMASEAVRNIK